MSQIKRRNEERWQSSLAAVSLTVTLVIYICVFNSLCFCLPPYPPYRWQSLALKSRIHFILLYARWVTNVLAVDKNVSSTLYIQAWLRIQHSLELLYLKKAVVL
ncbi:hypothetical protein ACFX2J_014536 [Malus domestica]